MRWHTLFLDYFTTQNLMCFPHHVLPQVTVCHTMSHIEFKITSETANLCSAAFLAGRVISVHKS